jgi:hypothetical protein
MDKMTIIIEKLHICGRVRFQTSVTTSDLIISVFLSVELRLVNINFRFVFAKREVT